MNIKPIDLPENQLISNVWSSHECQHIVSLLSNYETLGWRRKAFNELWSARSDISLGDNEGFWIGRESVFNAFVVSFENEQKANSAAMNKTHLNLAPEQLDAGMLRRPIMMSKMVEMAKDGKTAKGMWYSIGLSTDIEQDGEPHPKWCFARYAFDFINEGGEWKIWHMFCGRELKAHFGEHYIPGTGLRPSPTYKEPEPHPALPDIPRCSEYLYPRDFQARIYDVSSGWCPYPPVPEHYDTFSETFTYGPEPFILAGEGLYPEKARMNERCKI